MMYDFGSITAGFIKEGNKIPYFLRHIAEGDKKRLLRGFYSGAEKEGPASFLLHLPAMGINKLMGKNRVSKAGWKYVHQPALNTDTAIGHTLGKIPGLKGLFTAKEQIPWGKDLHKTILRPSATAPLVKARNLAVPIVAGVGLEKGVRSAADKYKEYKQLSSHKGDTMGNSDKEIQKMASILEPELREKVASTMLQLHKANKEHEKRAQATKLLYKQAELGYAPVPHTYHEFEQKLASLMGQDMAVLEKAMELTAGNLKLGELSGNDSTSTNAESTFQADVLSY